MQLTYKTAIAAAIAGIIGTIVFDLVGLVAGCCSVFSGGHHVLFVI